MNRMEREGISDRQFELLLERLDRIAVEVAKVRERLDRDEPLLRIHHELANLSESLQALAYAALGQQGPHVRRRRAG